MGYFNNAFIYYLWGLKVEVMKLSTEGQKALRFHKKILN